MFLNLCIRKYVNILDSVSTSMLYTFQHIWEVNVGSRTGYDWICEVTQKFVQDFKFA